MPNGVQGIHFARVQAMKYYMVQDGFLVGNGVSQDDHLPKHDGMETFAGEPPITLEAKPNPPTLNHRWNAKLRTWELDLEQEASTIRYKRSELLGKTDWTQSPDVPLATKDAWATYRQALRDITEQPDYPLNVIWPNSPKGAIK